MVNKNLLCSTIAVCAALSGQASASVIGVFHENLIGGQNTLFVFGSEGTMGTLSSNDGLNESFTIDASGVFERSFGSSGREMTQNGTVNDLSFRVDSADPISGIVLNRASETTDMTTLLDTDALGTDYRILTTVGRFGDGSQMSVTATEDNTVVTISSPIPIAGNPADTPFQVTLQAGESVLYESGSGQDLSGAKVTATKAVAVFAGAECTQVPDGVIACDHLVSQQFSTDNFDTKFRIAENFGGGVDGDLVRVMTDSDNTEVFLNGVSQGTIDAGEFLQIDNVTEGEITSTEPVTVGQFVRGQGGSRTTGDPAFAIIPSVDQELDNYAFVTPIGSDAFAQNFLNIAIDESIADTLTLNGALVDISGFNLLNGTLFGNLPIGVGIGTISASDNFLATISGFSGFDSYFSPIATAFSPGVSPPPPPVNPNPNPNPNPSAVPLPAAGWMLLAGFGGLAAMKRRKKV